MSAADGNTASWHEAADARDRLLRSAHDLAPLLRDRARRAEQERCVPAETVADFHRTGLIRMTQPHRYDGEEMGWDVLCEVAQVLAAADGAQAWIQAIMADHAQMVSCFPAEAQSDVWGSDTRAVMSASFEPSGRARPVEGGFRFSGEHNFASGVDHADWLICGGFIVDGETRFGPHFFLVPKADVTIIDDWHTMGLEGTGSKSFRVDDVFVPAHRMLDGAKARAGTPPGTEVNKAPVYRISRGIHTSCLFSALSVGMAQGLLDEWLSYTGSRVSHGVAVRSQPAAQMIAGECSAQIAAAEALYLGTIRESMQALAAGRTPDEVALSVVKRNAAFACKLALEAGTRLFNAAGGRVIFRGAALESRYRNLLASTSHFSVTWDTNALACGRALLEKA
jgi:3-hydroxy-9,10-secoandrosta-1,3,5(10)-triene-9,17-dione monooxygenase